MRFDEFYQDYLYHATYKPLIDSIQENGLGGKGSESKRWSDSKSLVYLATNPEVAYSYAESSDEVPEEWLEQIVVLKVNKKNLNADLLSLDKNVQDNEGSTLEYEGVIPWNNIEQMEYSE